MSNRKCCHERLILLFGSDQIIRRSLSSQLTDNFVVVSLSKMIKQDDCAPIYRFQHASFALLCAIYLPYVFHTNIWTLYTQPWPKENCTEFDNRTSCCPCQEHRNDANLFSSCRIWWDKIHGFDQRKVNVIEEWNLSCEENSRFLILIGTLTFLIGEFLGVILFALLADRFGRKFILLMCLYIPVLFGSLAAFTTTYRLFLILRWPVGFLNKSLFVLVFLMIIESCEYKSRAQIGSLLLSSLPIFSMLIGVVYFFLPDWRHIQLFGSLIATLTLCYPWFIPESRRWYVNSHRVSRVTKFLQIQTMKPNAISTIYDKPILNEDSLQVKTASLKNLFLDSQLRMITTCLWILWFLLSFCYQLIVFPDLMEHPMMNYILMNAVEVLAFFLAWLIAPRIGRRIPLAVLILISGLSTISLAIAFLQSGHFWLETSLLLTARVGLRISYSLLILFTAELYPTSLRATGLSIGLSGEILARLTVELVLYVFVQRTILLFISGGLLSLTCCLLLPLPETLLYDLPDTLTDLRAMGNSISNENPVGQPTIMTHYHMIDANTIACPRETQTVTSDLQDLLHLSPQPVFSSDENVQIYRTMTNQCYFASIEETIDQPSIDNQVMINLRAATTISSQLNTNQNNNNKQNESATTKL